MNLDQINAALRLVDREIWIVTAAAGGRRGGLVATWVASASIDRERPMLLAAIAPIHFTAELIDASGSFAAHLLREDQIDLAWNFARDSGRNRDKLAGLRIMETRRVSEGVAMETRSVSEGANPSSTGPPVLVDCLAWFTCRVIARYDAGDRLYYWSDITAGQHVNPGLPLRQQTLLRSLTKAQLAHLEACQQSDATTLRPRHDAWRKNVASQIANRRSS